MACKRGTARVAAGDVATSVQLVHEPSTKSRAGLLMLNGQATKRTLKRIKGHVILLTDGTPKHRGITYSWWRDHRNNDSQCPLMEVCQSPSVGTCSRLEFGHGQGQRALRAEEY